MSLNFYAWTMTICIQTSIMLQYSNVHSLSNCSSQINAAAHLLLWQARPWFFLLKPHLFYGPLRYTAVCRDGNKRLSMLSSMVDPLHFPYRVGVFSCCKGALHHWLKVPWISHIVNSHIPGVEPNCIISKERQYLIINELGQKATKA